MLESVPANRYHDGWHLLPAPRKERTFEHGEVRKMREDDHIRTQPQLLFAGDQPNLQTQSAARFCLRWRSQNPQGIMREVHSDDGKGRVIIPKNQKLRRKPRFLFKPTCAGIECQRQCPQDGRILRCLPRKPALRPDRQTGWFFQRYRHPPG